VQSADCRLVSFGLAAVDSSLVLSALGHIPVFQKHSASARCDGLA